MGADAIIVSDLGVFAEAREAAPELDIHISTQANITNYKAALKWHESEQGGLSLQGSLRWTK
jgi:putative protease